MKEVILRSAVLLLLSFQGIAQVSIGTKIPSSNATLTVSSQINGTGDYLGFMPPRLPSEAERNSINTQEEEDKGLLVFVQQTGCLDLWNGVTWIHVKCNGFTPETNDAMIWINEFHYDNEGSDVGEFIEVAGTAGLNLAGYAILLYNGSNGQVYSSIGLSGVLLDATGTGIGFSAYVTNTFQNGAPDGIALVDPTGNVVQFLSYEGVFTAGAGLASGETSEDIGVSQSADPILDPVGASLQLTGTGNQYADFDWVRTQLNTSGGVNEGQTFN